MAQNSPRRSDVVFYPFTKTLWLALDLTFRPVTWADLAGHGENLLSDAPDTEGEG